MLKLLNVILLMLIIFTSISKSNEPYLIIKTNIHKIGAIAFINSQSAASDFEQLNKVLKSEFRKYFITEKYIIDRNVLDRIIYKTIGKYLRKPNTYLNSKTFNKDVFFDSDFCIKYSDSKHQYFFAFLNTKQVIYLLKEVKKNMNKKNVKDSKILRDYKKSLADTINFLSSIKDDQHEGID